MSLRRNLDETALTRRQRSADQMRNYDALPPDLRRWMAAAALPWSPRSCRRLWQASRAKGESTDAALARLDRAQEKMLASDSTARFAMPNRPITFQEASK